LSETPWEQVEAPTVEHVVEALLQWKNSVVPHNEILATVSFSHTYVNRYRQGTVLANHFAFLLPCGQQIHETGREYICPLREQREREREIWSKGEKLGLLFSKSFGDTPFCHFLF